MFYSEHLPAPDMCVCLVPICKQHGKSEGAKYDEWWKIARKQHEWNATETGFESVEWKWKGDIYVALPKSESTQAKHIQAFVYSFVRSGTRTLIGTARVYGKCTILTLLCSMNFTVFMLILLDAFYILICMSFVWCMRLHKMVEISIFSGFFRQ